MDMQKSALIFLDSIQNGKFEWFLKINGFEHLGTKLPPKRL